MAGAGGRRRTPVDAVSLECASSFGDFTYNDVFDLEVDGGETTEATVTLGLDGAPVVLTESDEYPADGVSGGSTFGPYEVEGSFSVGDPTALTLVSIEFGDASDGGFLCTSESGRLTSDGSPSAS